MYQLFAEKVRDNKQLSSRWAIMQETRVEYFRGKDFTVFMKNHPELREILGTDKDLDVDEIVNTLLSKHLLIRCDRLVKTLRPGKKKLSSWPAHLQIHTVRIVMCKHSVPAFWVSLFLYVREGEGGSEREEVKTNESKIFYIYSRVTILDLVS